MVLKVLYISFPIMMLVGCNSSKRVIEHKDIIVEKSSTVSDSTLEPGYNPSQRAFALYLRSLPKEEKNKWISSGSFSEEERDNFLNDIDSLQMDIQLPDPHNSTKSDTLKNK